MAESRINSEEILWVIIIGLAILLSITFWDDIGIEEFRRYIFFGILLIVGAWFGFKLLVKLVNIFRRR